MNKETKKKSDKKEEPKISSINSEQIVLNKFTNWETDEYAQKTLMKMGYDLNRIKNVIAYIDEDEKGNKKVKLKVNLKPISSQQTFTSTVVNDVKEKINKNRTAKKFIDKINEWKQNYMDKHKQ